MTSVLAATIPLYLVKEEISLSFAICYFAALLHRNHDYSFLLFSRLHLYFSNDCLESFMCCWLWEAWVASEKCNIESKQKLDVGGISPRFWFPVLRLFDLCTMYLKLTKVSFRKRRWSFPTRGIGWGQIVLLYVGTYFRSLISSLSTEGWEMGEVISNQRS